ncbi:MAG: tRNA pseudouridine(55) synthase TruB, partial [Candidatus Saccharimonadales bacterium]
MAGILLIDKPSGWTSFDVVNYVRKMITQAEKRGLETSHLDGVQGDGKQRTEAVFKYGKGVAQPATPQSAKSSGKVAGAARQQVAAVRRVKVKVGHTGTLDPLATGLLVLLIGKDYTRRAGEFSKLDKSYEVTMKLGVTSTTGDEEGDKLAVSDKQPDLSKIQAALAKFTGEIMQTPPAFSAMKINGQRAYKLAREGKVVQLEPRPVTIHKIELKNYNYPLVDFTAEVSSGTYIRSLVADLGKNLKTGAYMSGLNRTKVGKFETKKALNLQNLNA